MTKKTSKEQSDWPFCFELIGYKFPGGNRIKSMPSWKYRELRNRIKRHLSDFIWKNYVSLQLKAPSFDHCEVRCTYIATRKRRRDYENLAFMFKPFLDELVELNILEDDNIDLIGEPEYNIKIGDQYGVRIEIK